MHTKLSIISSYKNSLFFVAWFPKNSRNKFINQEFYGQLPEQVRSNGLFEIFSKIVPLRAPRLFYSNGSKVKMSACWDYQQWPPILLRILLPKLGNTFFFVLTLWSWHLFSFLEMSTKFIMTKGVQNKFIHFMQMLTSKQSLQFSRSAFTNENIHNKNCP